MAYVGYGHPHEKWEEGQEEEVVSSWVEVQGEAQMEALPLTGPSFRAGAGVQVEIMLTAYLAEVEVGEIEKFQGVIHRDARLVSMKAQVLEEVLEVEEEEPV